MKAWIAVLLLAGCEQNPAVKAAEDMAREVCACKDTSCAFRATAEGTRRLTEHRSAKGSDGDGKKIVAAGERAAKCLATLGAK